MRYSEEFKQELVDCVRNGEPVKDVAESHGVNYNTLWNWCQQRGVSVHMKRGPYKKHDRCPKCGASSSHWRKDANNSLVDLNEVKPITCHNVSDYNSYDVFTCSSCGRSFEVSEYREDGDGYLDVHSPIEYAPSFCPNCGSMVVVE